MFRVGVFIVFLFFVQGCKTVSAWYDSTIHPKTHAYKELKSCKFKDVISVIKDDNKNILLRNSEIGLAHYYNRDYRKSIEFFERAKAAYNDEYRIAPNTAWSNYFLNEYAGESYDKVFIYNYNALNYLLLGDIERARQEAKKSYILQEQERVKARAFKQEYSKKNRNRHLISHYQKLFSSVDIRHNPYQNPFAYYISALANIESDNYGIAMSDINTAQNFLFDKTYDLIERKRKEYEDENYKNSVEIFFDIGRGPLKYEKKEMLDIGNGEIRQAYLPTYNITHSQVSFIKILDQNNNEVAISSLLTDINAIKVNEFKEKLPSLLYMLSKETATDFVAFTAEQKSKIVSTILRMSFAMYGKNNTSTWSLLPEKILVASFIPKKDNSYKMQVFSKSGNILDEKVLNISKNNKTKNIYRHFSIREKRICENEEMR